VVVTEPEANHNAAAFRERFDEAVNYYALLFDCLERLVLGEEIRGVVAPSARSGTMSGWRMQWARRMEAGGLSYGAMMDGGLEAAAEPRVGRVRGHARRARRRVLLLLAPEAALPHLRVPAQLLRHCCRRGGELRSMVTLIIIKVCLD
jgi:hypothetical protein